MDFKKMTVGAVCAACGATIGANGLHPAAECLPRFEMCSPPAIHLIDGQHKDPRPIRTMPLEVTTTSSATASFSDLGFVIRNWPPKT